MKLVVMLLEIMPFLLRIHLLHLLAQIDILSPQNLESLIKPLKSLQHGHASLLPEHGGDLSLVGPHLLLLLLLHVIELAVLVVAHCHRLTGGEKLGICVDILLDV